MAVLAFPATIKISKPSVVLATCPWYRETTLKKHGFNGETGLKIDLQSWGDLDLLYSRMNDANHFTIGGNAPITENLGLEVGYTYTPKGKDHKRAGAWNMGVRVFY